MINMCMYMYKELHTLAKHVHVFVHVHVYVRLLWRIYMYVVRMLVFHLQGWYNYCFVGSDTSTNT